MWLLWLAPTGRSAREVARRSLHLAQLIAPLRQMDFFDMRFESVESLRFWRVLPDALVHSLPPAIACVSQSVLGARVCSLRVSAFCLSWARVTIRAHISWRGSEACCAKGHTVRQGSVNASNFATTMGRHRIQSASDWTHVAFGKLVGSDWANPQTLRNARCVFFACTSQGVVAVEAECSHVRSRIRPRVECSARFEATPTL